MIHLVLLMFTGFLASMPPAAKALGILAFVYGIIQILKQSTVLAPFIVGWKATALNAVLSLVGLLVIIPPDQLYNLSTLGTTLTTWLGIVLGAAGVHGTVSKLSEPSTPPNPPTP